MNAHEYSILKLLEGNDKFFYIPVYQREYSWGEGECETLLSDLRFVVKQKLTSHFFGSIVYSQKDLGGIASYCIIDGQQRITTITLLLLAIYNIFKDYNRKYPGFLSQKDISLEKIENNYFYVDPYKKPRELKLSLTDADSSDFSSLFETKDDTAGLITNLKNLNVAGSNIHQNYKYFYNELSKNEIEDVIDIFNSLRKLVIVNVSLEANDDPQLIFESINSKIKELKESDKIRNFLFMQVDYDSQKTLYKKYWVKIANNVPDESKLIRFYLAIKTNAFVPEKQLYYYFKAFMTEKPFLKSEDVLSELLKYSEYWKQILSFDYNSKFEFQKSIYRINKLDISTIFPLFFVCFDEMDNGLAVEDMNEIMSTIESYLVRRNFLNLPIGSLNKIFAFMPAEIDKLVKGGIGFKEALISCLVNKTAKTRFPRDSEFKDAFVLFDLYNAKPAFRKYVLERLSNYNNKEIINVDESISSGKLTIEHVMPQCLSDEWKRYLGPDYDSIHSKYLNTIGNLTLTAYNSEYSNLLFSEKKQLPGKGFNFSSLYLNEYIKDCTDWKETQMKERAGLLFERALEIWRFPYNTKKENSFNLMNPATWNNVTITQFAKSAFDYMLTNNILTPNDIAELKDKTLSKKKLGAYYEVLTTNRNRDDCKKCHWAAKEYIVYDEKLYLSFEWFEEQFDKLSEYVKLKLNL